MKRATPQRRFSREQEQLNNEFTALFAEVEQRLIAKVSKTPSEKVKMWEAIERYAERNVYWGKSKDAMKLFAQIRNLIAHESNASEGAPVAVAASSVDALRGIRDELLKPRLVGEDYTREVVTVTLEDTLATVVEMAYELSFSQFPVVTDGAFGGMVTETEIARWMGHRLRTQATLLDLERVTVASVLREKDPFRKGMPAFCFARVKMPVAEVMSWFALQPGLQVVLLTESGNKKTAIEGIVTQWDAARYAE